MVKAVCWRCNDEPRSARRCGGVALGQSVGCCAKGVLPVGFVEGDGNVGKDCRRCLGSVSRCGPFLEDAEAKAELNDVWDVVDVNDSVGGDASACLERACVHGVERS